jgi:hypothetical protein
VWLGMPTLSSRECAAFSVFSRRKAAWFLSQPGKRSPTVSHWTDGRCEVGEASLQS